MTTAALARRGLRAVLVGPGAQRVLRDAAAATAGGTVQYAFGPGGYLRFGEAHVLLAPARSPLGPLSLLVAGLGCGDLVVGDPAVVSGGALCVGPLHIDFAGAREASRPRYGPLHPRWRPALCAALEVVAAAPAELELGLDALSADRLSVAAAQLAGRGEGLTPAGDDVLAGFAAWRWASGAPVALASQRCAPLGYEYLRCAERGELPAPAAAVMTAIRAGDAVAAQRRACGLAEWGASSGAALLWGLAAGAAATPA